MRVDDHPTRWELVPYFHGRVLDVSEGSTKTFPHFISSIEIGMDDPWKTQVFADGALDAVCSSGVLHLLDKGEVRRTLGGWSRVVKDGGHIMIHLPQSAEGCWPVSYSESWPRGS